MSHTRRLQVQVEVERGLARSTRIQVPVTLQDEPRVPMAQLFRDHVRRRPCRDHQRCVGMPKVMERQPIQLGTSDRRPEDTSHEVLLPPHSASRHFVVSRIDSINPKTAEDELELLRRGNNYSQAVEDGIEVALDTFFLEALDGVFGFAMRANFACLAALPMDFTDKVLELKRAELEHEHRVFLRRKISIFFGRDADDIAEHDKRNPDDLRKEREAAL